MKQKLPLILLLALLTGLLPVLNLFAQEQPVRVTLREVNALPQSRIDSLMNLGPNMTIDEIQQLAQGPYAGKKIAFTAVLLSDPLNSGLANFSGGRISRMHVFVRDTSASSQGNEGMAIQIVDGNWDTNGLDGFLPGDVLDIVGTVSYFTGAGGASMQLAPESIEFVGDYQGLGLNASIMDPIVTTTADINRNVGGGKMQINWQKYPDLNSNYVRIEQAVVIDRTIDNTGRPDWMISTDGGQTLLHIYDISLRYRNDRSTYQPGFNTRNPNDPFVPPPPGSVINLQGYLVFQGDDPFGIGQPNGAIFAIAPWEDTDVEIVESPPIITGLTKPNYVPGANPVSVSVNVQVDPARTLASVELYYTTSVSTDTSSISMTPGAGISFTAEIPPQPDGAFVSYWVEAEDNTGARSRSETQFYRVLVDGINEIKDIQETFGGGPGPSPFENITTDMDITATVQSQPSISGLVSIQDDANLNPWTGILLNPTQDLLQLQRGDVIHISRAHIYESFGVTMLDSVSFTKQSSGDFLGYKRMTTDQMQLLEVAEAHEDMLVRFDSVTIVDPDAGFGEWRFSSDGTLDNSVLADDRSQAIGRDFASTTFVEGMQLAYIQGIWWYSFGNYKLVPEDPTTDIKIITTAAEDDVLPTTPVLVGNYPNPFTHATTITFQVGAPMDVSLEVFDLLGRKVRTLVEGPVPAGTHTIHMQARDLPAGLYIYRLSAGTTVVNRTMTILK